MSSHHESSITAQHRRTLWWHQPRGGSGATASRLDHRRTAGTRSTAVRIQTTAAVIPAAVLVQRVGGHGAVQRLCCCTGAIHYGRGGSVLVGAVLVLGTVVSYLFSDIFYGLHIFKTQTIMNMNSAEKSLWMMLCIGNLGLKWKTIEEGQAFNSIKRKL